MTATLFDPITLGAIAAPNRILMAPLTRGRSEGGHVPLSDLKAEYYSQRSSAGLIIAEATGISQEGLGWPSAPGIWSDAQITAWKHVTQAVHDAGGRIILQLWHMGRLVHPDFLGGAPCVSASATTAPGYAHTAEGKKEYTQARGLDISEIPRIVSDYAVVDAIGSERTSVRLSPNGETQGADDSNPVALFTAAAAALQEIGIAFLELREIKPYGNFGQTEVPRVSPEIRKIFKGPLVLNQEYTKELADADLASGLADAISFGRPYVSNPDLVERLRVGAELTPDNFKTWYAPAAEGYADYPFLAQADA